MTAELSLVLPGRRGKDGGEAATMHDGEFDDGSRWSRAWIVGVGLMLALTTMLPAAQAVAVKVSSPCPFVSTDPPDFGVNDCGAGVSTGSSSVDVVNDVLGGKHPTTSSSAAFPAANATAVAEDVRISWALNESAIDANVTAFHVQRGLDPTIPSTMSYIATAGPDAGTYLDKDAMTSGEPWYVVTVELDDGSSQHSQPFRVSNVHGNH